MAQTNDAIVAPAGPVWRAIRANAPSIELYNADGSHPSLAGTYAITMAFYAAIFRADPSALNFTVGLESATEQSIREAAKNVVYNSLLTPWLVGAYDADMADCFEAPSPVGEAAENFVRVFSKDRFICVDFAAAQDSYLLEVHDMMGKKVHSETSSANFRMIDISNISNGTYIVIIHRQGKLFLSKVVLVQ